MEEEQNFSIQNVSSLGNNKKCLLCKTNFIEFFFKYYCSTHVTFTNCAGVKIRFIFAFQTKKMNILSKSQNFTGYFFLYFYFLIYFCFFFLKCERRSEKIEKCLKKEKNMACVDEEPVILQYETEQICQCCKEKCLIKTPFLVYSCVMGCCIDVKIRFWCGSHSLFFQEERPCYKKKEM